MQSGFELLLENEMILNPGMSKQEALDFVGLPGSEQEVNQIDFKSFKDMIRAMRNLRGAKFIPCDFPSELCAGYIDKISGRVFRIRISDLKRSIENDFTLEQKEILQKIFKSQGGRIIFGEFCSSHTGE